MSGDRQIALSQQGITDVLELQHDAAIVVNRDGIITIANGQASSLFGYDLEEMIGLHLDTLLPERFRGAHPRHRRHYFEAPHARPMGAGLHLFGLRSDKSEFVIDISLRPITIDGELHALAVIRDKTTQSEMQSEIIAVQTLIEERFRSVSSLSIRVEELNKLIEVQVAPMAHRITQVEEVVKVQLPQITTRVEEVEKSMSEFTDQWKEFKPAFDRIDAFFKNAKRALWAIAGIILTQFVIWLLSQLPHFFGR